jgi:hypothetical protein
VGCPTTAEVTAALAGRTLQTVGVDVTDLTLCDDRRFFLVQKAVGAPPDDAGFQRAGAWAVRIVGAGLGLVLADDTAQAPVVLERDAAGGFVLDGVRAVLGGAPRCGNPTFDAVGQERTVLVNATRAVTDRNLVIAGGTADEEQLILCSSGSFVRRSVSSGSSEGTWTMDVSSGEGLLRITTAGGTGVFGVTTRADGAVLLDSEIVEQRDARTFCLARDLQERLTAALNDSAFFFTVNVLNIPVRHKLGLCASRRYRLESTTSETGTWEVVVSSSSAVLRLVKDGTMIFRDFPLAFDANGIVRVSNTTPIDDAGLVDAACGS